MTLPVLDLNDLTRAIAQQTAALLSSSLGDDVLTTEQAAALLKIHPDTVGQLAARGDLPARKVGREWRFRRSALLEHVTPVK